MQIETEKNIIQADRVDINVKPKDYYGQFWNGFFWVLGASCGLVVSVTIARLVHLIQ